MYVYQVANRILTIRIAGNPGPQERQRLFATIRGDASVPIGAVLLIDAMDSTVELPNIAAAVERVKSMMDQLGPKLMPVCALLPGQSHSLQAQLYQRGGESLGVRIGIFPDEATALGWLAVWAKVGVEDERRRA